MPAIMQNFVSYFNLLDLGFYFFALHNVSKWAIISRTVELKSKLRCSGQAGQELPWTCVFIPLQPQQHLPCTLSSGCAITFCLPCGAYSLMCLSEAERIFFLATEVFTMVMIRETGVSEHIKCYCSAAVSCGVPFLVH